jgi:hypothetical protein
MFVMQLLWPNLAGIIIMDVVENVYVQVKKFL